MGSERANEESRMPVGMMIGTAAVILLVVGFFVSMTMLSNSAMDAPIADTEEFRQAILGKKAINCLVSHDADGDFMLQTDDGFTKVKVVIDDTDGISESMLVVRDAGTYYWDAEGTALRLADSSAIDEFIEELSDGADVQDAFSDYTLSCDSASKVDFSLPSLNFVDLSE